MARQIEISVVIPVFNSASCLNELVVDICLYLNLANKSFEIILVDDGSKDKSWELIKEISSRNENVSGFLLGRNFGQHQATLCGIEMAVGDWVVTMDDDFEHSPNLIVPLVEKAKNLTVDLLYATPSKFQKNLIRSLASKFFKFVSKIENADAGKGSSFRVISKKVSLCLHIHQSHLFFIDEILLWYTDNLAVEKVEFNKSRKIVSGYNYLKLFSLSKNVYMISTTMPLKLIKFLGGAVAFLSFLGAVYSLLHKMFFKTQPGFTSLILSILFSTGLILLCLGVLAEYLGNLLIMQNKKPCYSIREKV